MRALLIKAITGWALMGGVLLLLIVAASALNAAGFTANAVARMFGGTVSGLPGYEDAVTLFVGVAGLAMFPYAQLHRAHAAVDTFMQNAPDWANRAVFVTSSLLVAGVALAMGYMLILGTVEVRADRVETTVLGWPVWVFMPFAVVSCILWAAAALLALKADDGT
ncbi:TRAP transporter small permease [Pseudooctadecabacter sp.]|uniref:TRAP transporter small permease n=1 Tax=Pseudooctadecabacter sp. TaxID=1966338 RepID=UPI0025D0BF75|nr:TRAP transporter small permease subunit [Pseudooctadecabacter sp.]